MLRFFFWLIFLMIATNIYWSFITEKNRLVLMRDNGKKEKKD